MASYYGRRNILNLQLPGHYRLYPVSHTEPVFDTEIGDLPRRSARAEEVSPEQEASLRLARAATRGSTQSARRSQSEERHDRQRSTPSAAPAIPPPAYGAGAGTGAGLPLSRTISSGATLVASASTGTRKARVVQVNWAFHPSLSGPHQKRDRWLRYLGRKAESLSDDFPEDFMSLLVAGQSTEENISKIQELYKARIDHLNNWVIPNSLVITRLFMALLEIIDLIIVILFIVALGVTGGKQEGLLEGAEVALILVILLTGGFINHIRIKRWQLRSVLRNLSRDWSPLPSTSSTAADLVNAYIGGADLEAGTEAGGEVIRNLQNDDALKPVMRWSMFQREGTVWTSWRPVVKVELIVPTVPQRTAPPPDQSGATGEDWVPVYSAREATGERVVQFAA